jgi:hypothetical protein
MKVREHGSGYLFFQDKLGGEISLAKTKISPELSFDVTIVQILLSKSGHFAIGRYGILEVQTMDFHGSYKGAVEALTNALDLHQQQFPQTLSANLNWASRGVEGPNIANVFKPTFYQMLIKFQLSSTGAAAGTVLALPRSVWDSWQPFLGGPAITATTAGYSIIAGSDPTELNSFICVFDIDPEVAGSNETSAGVANAVDISPVRIETFIRVDPQTLAQRAFQDVPKAILYNISAGDPILATIRGRLTKWWAGADLT